MNRPHLAQKTLSDNCQDAATPLNSGNAGTSPKTPNDLLRQLGWAAELCDCLGWNEAKRYILFMRRGLEEGEP